MKNVTRIVLFVLLVALMVPMAVGNAQEGGDDEPLVAEISAVYFQSATSGTLADNGDGTYTLTLEGIDPQLLWIATVPAPEIQSLDLVAFTASWAAAADLAAEATLSAGEVNVEMSLSAPVYTSDTGTIAYTAVVNSVDDGSKDPQLPTAFEAANLLITWSFDFQVGLVEGTVLRYGETRATPEECAAAQQTWNDYTVWRNAKTAEYVAARNTCRGRDGTINATTKANACELATQLANELNAAATNISPTLSLLTNECPAS